jgi:hypothetical protein
MNVQQLWLAQATQAPRISLEYIRHQASSLERGVRRRAVINYVLSAAALGVFAWQWQVQSSQPLLLVPMVWFIGLMFYLVFRLHRYVAAQASSADAGVLDTLRFHRLQLERQRDFRRWSWRWTVPFYLLPGAGLKIAAMIIYGFPWVAIVEVIVTLALGAAVVIGLGEFRARQSQREIDALESLARDG